MKVLSQSKSKVVYMCDCNGKGTSKCKGCEETSSVGLKQKEIYKSQNKKAK